MLIIIPKIPSIYLSKIQGVYNQKQQISKDKNKNMERVRRGPKDYVDYITAFDNEKSKTVSICIIWRLNGSVQEVFEACSLA